MMAARMYATPRSPSVKCQLLPAALIFTIMGAAALAGPPDPVPEARGLMRQKKYAEAAERFETYLATNRFDGRAWADYSFCLHSSQRYEPAIAAAGKAIAC